MKDAGHKAAMPNPALGFFNALVGEWKTVGTHGYVPDTILLPWNDRINSYTGKIAERL